MKPHPRAEEQDDLLRPCLTDMIDLRHELAKLAAPPADRSVIADPLLSYG